MEDRLTFLALIVCKTMQGVSKERSAMWGLWLVISGAHILAPGPDCCWRPGVPDCSDLWCLKRPSFQGGHCRLSMIYFRGFLRLQRNKAWMPLEKSGGRKAHGSMSCVVIPSLVEPPNNAALLMTFKDSPGLMPVLSRSVQRRSTRA